MSSERNLLGSVIQSREAFDSIADHIQKGDLSEQGYIILSAVREYYDRDDSASEVDSELLRNDVGRSVSSPKHREMFDQLIESAACASVSPSNVVHDFIAVKRDGVGARLASALAAGKSIGEVRPLLDEYNKWAEADAIEGGSKPALVSGKSVVDLVEATKEQGLIEIWPESLNNRLDGGLRRGHHMLIFARPEMGKTMMLVNMIAGFAAQDLTVLYVGNEDPQDDIIERIVCRLAGMNKYELYEDPDLADYLAREKGYENVVLMDAAPGTPKQIAEAIIECEPDVVLIDQLRNINVHEDQFVQKLEKAATAARNLAKEYNVLVVSVTQAGDSASGKGALDMGDVDSSNTGIPAQVDVMVGIGGTADDVNSGRRILSLPKNKRSGRHEYFPVGVDPQLSRMRSLG